MNIVRLRKTKTGKTKIQYSEEFFGGLFGMTGIWIDELQLRQRFKGQVPDEIELDIRAVEHDEEREGLDRDLRNHVIQEQRARREQDKAESADILEGMKVREALERLGRKLK